MDGQMDEDSPQKERYHEKVRIKNYYPIARRIRKTIWHTQGPKRWVPRDGKTLQSQKKSVPLE